MDGLPVNAFVVFSNNFHHSTPVPQIYICPPYCDPIYLDWDNNKRDPQ